MRREETPEKLFAAGKAYASVGDTTRAEEYLAAAMSRGGDEKTIVPLLIGVCVHDGRYRSAIQYAEPYVQKHPSDVKTRFLLGTLYSAVGDSARARSELEWVVAAEPDKADPHWALAVLLRDELKDAVGADGQFREYLRLAPSGEHADEARASLLKEVP